MAKEYKAGPIRRKPTHPGAIVKRDVEALGLSVNQVALAIGVTRAALGNVVSEKSAVSPDMALRLAAYFRTEANLLLDMQRDYDVWTAREKIKGELDKIEPVEWDRDEVKG
ncbi:HigA family addiction module antitoxin [Bradyrhizobium sp. YR681]|uniref:HigA family addiction module antitoxin n=1 Tax=Bradyrhizobium sp. YR681 TaxID=1144344 RepID=UPI00055F1ACC|nr:HigA family addiction module antitoxin [Bradyrhizobium sp. YR681]